MTSSLVGSEMCIRDRSPTPVLQTAFNCTNWASSSALVSSMLPISVTTESACCTAARLASNDC
eukprot:3387775-Prorocentrum_lima.AAC.1